MLHKKLLDSWDGEYQLLNDNISFLRKHLVNDSKYLVSSDSELRNISLRMQLINNKKKEKNH